MTEDKGILIKNIYYMLTYAFQVLRQSNYESIEAESFENIHDLFAEILSKSVSQQLKQGLHKEYISKQEVLPVLKGKLDIGGTIKEKLQRKQLVSCEHDELTENNVFNQIIKTTADLLIRHSNVNTERRSALKKNLLFFGDIDCIEPSLIKWDRLRFHRNNQTYKMLMNICWFILDGMLLSTEKGSYKIASFIDDQKMHRLYEHFVLEYYRKHFPQLKVGADRIKWDIAEDENDIFLPAMQTDITLKNEVKTLIIDTKYYGKAWQTQYDANTLRSNNLYQIFTYVKNLDKESTGNVGGMLLYAKTSERISPDCDYTMGNNKISVKTLDLNLPFNLIASQLNKIAEKFFEI